MKQRSNDVIIQKAREHITLYYLDGNDGLYKEFFLMNFWKFFLTFMKFTQALECWLTVEDTKIIAEDCGAPYDSYWWLSSVFSW